MERDRLAGPPADRARGLGSQRGKVCGCYLAELGLPLTPPLHTLIPLPRAVSRGKPGPEGMGLILGSCSSSAAPSSYSCGGCAQRGGGTVGDSSTTC